MYVTEASCDACPKKCRLELFSPGARLWKGGELRCVAGVTTPKWVGADATPATEPVFERDFAVAGLASRRLLACVGCSTPCLLETEGLALRCVASSLHERSDYFGWNPVK